MLITRLILDHYRRLMLRNISHFEYTPKDIHQLILGTNGSGKTSVMRELSPLPAHGSDYAKGGYKVVHCTHRGSTYVLTSTFSTSAGRHSMLRDGVELNPGQTATVQRELVQTWLGLDTELMDVLLDTVRFTQMPALRRREWIMRLSGADMSYAMRVWQSLRVQLRDTQGVVKHLNQRCSEALQRLPTADDIEGYQNRVSTLQSTLTTLMEAREPNLPEKVMISDRIAAVLTSIKPTVQSIMRVEWSPQGHRSLDSITECIGAIRNHQYTIQQRLDIAHTEIDSIQDIVDALESTHCAGVDELRTRIASTRDAIDAIQLPAMYRDLKDVTVLMSLTDNVMPELVDVLNNMSDDKERFTITTRETHRRDVEQKSATLNRAIAVMGRLQHRIDHIQTADHTTCPQCGHAWQPGVREDELRELVDRHAVVAKEVDKLRGEIDIHQRELELGVEYLNYIRRWTRVIGANPKLQPLWDWVTDAWDADTPKVIIPMLAEWRHYLNVTEQYQSLQTTLTQLDNALHHALSAGVDGVSHYVNRMAQLTEIVTLATQQQLALRDSLQAAETHRATAIALMQHGHAVSTAMAELDDLMCGLARIAKHDILTGLIRDRQSELALATNTLNAAITAAAVMADITEQRDAAVAKAAALSAMIDELSPVDGLIAEQLTEFIGCFAEQLTTVINSVWTYPLEVLPCGHESGELDYKFPISVNAGALGAADVSLGSKSQVAAVDFAFKLVVMMYLGLQDYPLYLDEVAVALDEQHRFNIVMFIKTYVETRQCSQMFMISHYDAQSGAFHPSEVCILDTANIVHIPDVYNQHVVMN